MTKSKTTLIREHVTSSIDSKVYVTSHQTFQEYLFDLYPPIVVSESSQSSDFSKQEYAAMLVKIPLESILDKGKCEKNVFEIGQKAFNQFKKAADGDSFAGKDAIVDICESVITMSSDGSYRKQYIERAWHGVGDKTWIWQQ